MRLPFWRYMNERPPPGFPVTGAFKGIDMPAGYPMKYLYNDGAGFRDVTDIDWQMLAAFRRLDWIVADGARKLDEIKTMFQNPVTNV